MKIIILQGSPNRNKSTNILVEEFTKGAESSGHTTLRFDVAEMNIKPCTGCVACGYEGHAYKKMIIKKSEKQFLVQI
ncbi:MAG TPA: NAD(P)H-dependent oxidoreductase [Lachnospiraceae bacterium]|nr:NAD(P)H-dependent oxidoreductase [Lachnospiraceae bacterium]HPF30097.1 NAD(P)H-dependent oxidoreductase [Lachnospiraceae bacterium]